MEIIPLSQLRKELKKIQSIVKATKSKEIVYSIIDILDKYEDSQSTTTEEELIVKQCRSHLSVSNSSQEDVEYDISWSQPSPSDYNALKLIRDCLETETNIEELRDCLLHVTAKTDDFPVEFFMVPPYLISSVLNLLSKTSNLTEECIELISLFLKSLSLRMDVLKLPSASRYSHKNDCNTRNQLKVSSVVSIILITVLEKIDESLADDNYSILNLLKLIMKLTTSFPRSCKIDYMRLFQKMLKILRSYRKRIFCSTNALNIRLSYFLVLCASSKIIPFVNGYSDSDVKELKTAIFDQPLHEQFPEIIQHLSSKIHINPELSNFLNIKDCFSPIVEILQSKDKIPRDELILIGYELLQTVSIVESLALTQLLFKTIRGSLIVLTLNSELKTCALKIIHRLLSCASSRIRIHFYSQVNACVKESFALLMERESNQINLLKHGIFGMYIFIKTYYALRCFKHMYKISHPRESCLIII